MGCWWMQSEEGDKNKSIAVFQNTQTDCIISYKLYPLHHTSKLKPLQEIPEDDHSLPTQRG